MHSSGIIRYIISYNFHILLSPCYYYSQVMFTDAIVDFIFFTIKRILFYLWWIGMKSCEGCHEILFNEDTL